MKSVRGHLAASSWPESWPRSCTPSPDPTAARQRFLETAADVCASLETAAAAVTST